MQKTEESSFFCGLTRSFHVIFHKIYFLTTNGDIKKIIDCKSLRNSQGNFYGGVSFSKVISLQFSDCNFAIKKIHHWFFLGNVPKTSSLKKIKSIFLRKISIVDQRLNKAAALQYTTLNFIKKAEVMQNRPVEALKVLIYSQLNIIGGGFFSMKLQF